MYFPRPHGLWGSFRVKIWFLSIALLCQLYSPTYSTFSLAFILSVVTMTFSPKCFNCILPLRTLKQTEGNSPKSNQLVRDWVQSMLYLQSPHLVQWIPPPQAPGVGLFNLELQDVGVVQEGHKLSETYKKYLVLEWESLAGFRLSAAALYWKD